MTELPSSWVWARLDEIADVRLGRQRSPKNHTGSHMRPYLRAANVGWDGLKLNDVKEMNFTDKEAAIYRLREGDIVLSEASGSPGEVGKPAIWNNEIEDCCFQNTLLRVRSHGPDPHYLLHFLRFEAMRGAFVEHSRGVGIHHLGVARLAAWRVPIAPLAAQRRIVAAVEAHLSGLDFADVGLQKAIRRSKGLVAQICEAASCGTLASATFESDQLTADKLTHTSVGHRRGRPPIPASFSPDRNLPPGWSWASIDEISEFVIDGDHNPPKRTSIGIPHITAKGVRNFQISLDGCSFVSEQGFAQTARRYLPLPGDVIVTCVGTIGRTAVVPTGLEFSADRNLAAIRLVRNWMLPEFLQLVLNSSTWQNYLIRASSSTAQPHLYLGDLRSLPVPVPPLEHQRRISYVASELLNANNRTVGLARKAQVRVAHLRSGILKRAFSGQLGAHDVNDEATVKIFSKINHSQPTSSSVIKARAPRASRQSPAPLHGSSDMMTEGFRQEELPL